MDEWPLVGRTSELEQVGALLSRGRGGMVFAGPAGVGKTRLGAEALGLAAARGWTTIRVSATQASASIPFGAFAALLPDLPAGVDRTETMRAIVTDVMGRAQGARLALLIDDAHLLDEASAALAHQLAANASAFILATIRSGEPVSDAVVALWKDGLTERLELRPFSEAEVRQALSEALGGVVDATTSHRFWEHTEGNVLFLRELVVATLEAGSLTQTDGAWRLHGRLPASARLIELVEARFAGLEDNAREVLPVLALGEPLGVELLSRLVPAEQIDELERRGIVRVEADGRRLNARLGHPLFSEIVRARLSPLRTRALSCSLADVLEATGARRRDDLLRLASWRLVGGGEVDAELMLAGARQTHARQDFVLAEELGRAAYEAGGGFDAGHFLGIVISQGGRPDDAEQALAALAADTTDDSQQAALAISRAHNFLFLRRVEDAIAVLAAAEASITNSDARSAVATERAITLLFSGQIADARELSGSLVADAKGRTLISLSLVAGYTAHTAGHLDDGLEINQRGLETMASLEGPPHGWTGGVLRFVHVDALSLAGRLAEAEAYAADWYSASVEEGSPLEQGYATSGLCKLFTRQGRVKTAVRWGRVSDRVWRDAARPSERGYTLVYLAHALALAGAPDDAVATMAEFDALPGAGGGEFGPEILQARAWIALAAGDKQSACALLDEAAQAARRQGSCALESWFLHDLARIGEAAAVAARLTELSTTIEGPAAIARALHANALASSDGSGLDDASVAFQEASMFLHAAEASADAAVVWQKAGDSRKAAAAQQRTAALVEGTEGAVTPALATIAPARAALTKRELEIAQLAARGLPNKDIAAQLALSVRTVENKLHAAYSKLGIDGRTDLTRALEGY